MKNVNEWKEYVINDRSDISKNTMVRSMPALGFRQQYDSYADLFVYPTFLFEDLETTFPEGDIENFQYRIENTGTDRAKENLYVCLDIHNEFYKFRYTVDYKRQQLAFFYSINFEPCEEVSPEQKETVFQLFQLAQSFLHTHSPHRLFLCTQQYRTLFPDIIYEKLEETIS